MERAHEARAAFAEATRAFDGYLASGAANEIAQRWSDRTIFELLKEETAGLGLAR